MLSFFKTKVILQKRNLTKNERDSMPQEFFCAKPAASRLTKFKMFIYMIKYL